MDICSLCGDKIKKANLEALNVRNGAMSWWVSKTLYCSRAFLFWTTLFTVQSLAGTWKPFWYEAISCAKEFDLFISIWGNSWNVLPSLCLSLPLYLFVRFVPFFQVVVPTLPFLMVIPLELLFFLQIMHSILLFPLSALSFVLFPLNQCAYVQPVSDGHGQARWLLWVYLIYIKPILEFWTYLDFIY